MKKIFLKFFLVLIVSSSNGLAGDFKTNIGNFAFSDNKKHSGMLDLSYDFTENEFQTILGTIKPKAGVLFTNRLSSMAYAGFYADYKLSIFKITPSFTPGLYSSGEGKRGKDLGSIFQFKSQINIGLDLSKLSFLNLGYSHISNAGIGENNPGANTYLISVKQNF